MDDKVNKKIFITVDKWLVTFQTAVAVFTLLMLAFIMSAEVILRRTDFPFLGIEETTVLMGFWFFFMGAGLCTREKQHVRAGIASLVLKKRKKALRIVDLSVSLITIVASAGFGYMTMDYSLFILKNLSRSAYLRWPLIIWVSSMTIGFILMTFYFIVEMVQQWRNLDLQEEVKKC